MKLKQDSTAANTASECMNLLDEVLGQTVIYKGIWVPRSQDLSSPGFFFCGAVKAVAYENNIHPLDEFRLQVSSVRGQSRERTLKVELSLLMRAQQQEDAITTTACSDTLRSVFMHCATVLCGMWLTAQ
jgi:hypothetical protein